MDGGGSLACQAGCPPAGHDGCSLACQAGWAAADQDPG